MNRTSEHNQILRLSLYGNAAVIAKISEGRHAEGWFVHAEGAAAFRGRTTFPTRHAAVAFVEQLDRQLMAVGFQCLWRTEERREEPRPERVERETMRRIVFGLHRLWSVRLGRGGRLTYDEVSMDWVAAHTDGARG